MDEEDSTSDKIPPLYFKDKCAKRSLYLRE